ncbi:MAG: 3-dehydroquinate synthase II [bacterium]|nr:3-dehydroquinate synthase II [bacterium]
MKTIWVKAVPWNKEVVCVALESGADAVLVPSGFSEKVKELGIIKTVAEDGDLKLGEDVIEFEINSKEDEEKACKVDEGKTLIIKTRDWKIIPLENLIAKRQGLIAEVKDLEEAKTCLQILERGVDGVLLNTRDLREIKRCVRQVKSEIAKIDLKVAKITKVKPVGMGDRVCIDTCTIMKQGEGILVGNKSSCMFLVHSESVENPYVTPRPFRVNAGAVHAYTLTPDKKTKYLVELNSGDEVLVVDRSGDTQIAVIGRIKIEKRPLILVEAVSEDEIISLILQNAETIRLVDKSGLPISVLKLEKGSEVLIYKEKGARHFGMKISETIQEK